MPSKEAPSLGTSKSVGTSKTDTSRRNLGLKLNPDRLFLCAQAQPTRQGSGPSHSASRKEVLSPGTLNTKPYTPNPKPSRPENRKEVLSPGTLNTKF